MTAHRAAAAKRGKQAQAPVPYAHAPQTSTEQKQNYERVSATMCIKKKK